MSTATLVAGFVVNTLAAVVFAVVGLRLSSLPVAREARLAGRMFVLWWWGFAGFLFLWIALPMGLVVVGFTDLAVLVGLLYVSMFSLCLGVGCLAVYLLYLLTGRKWIAGPVLAYYSALFVMSVVLFTVKDPVDVDVRDWWVDLVYATPLSTVFHVFLALLVLPTTFLALAYFSLVRRTRDPMMKFRITVVAWSLIVWGLSGMMARAFALDELQLVARTLLGLVAAVLILVAHEAPEGLRRRIEAAAGYRTRHGQMAPDRSLREPGSTRGRSYRERRRERRVERENELRWRMEELV